MSKKLKKNAKIDIVVTIAYTIYQKNHIENDSISIMAV